MDSERQLEALAQAPEEAEVEPLVRSGVFPFFRLPPEIRNRIYELCFQDTDPKGIKIRTVTISPPETWISRDEHQQKQNPLAVNILQANRQLYSEANGLLYKLNTFYFTECADFQNFLSYIGPQNRVALRRLKLFMSVKFQDNPTAMRPCFALLESMDDLTIVLDFDMPDPADVALAFYRVARLWLGVMVARKGGKATVVDAIELSHDALINFSMETRQQSLEKIAAVSYSGRFTDGVEEVEDYVKNDDRFVALFEEEFRRWLLEDLMELRGYWPA